MLTLDLTNAPQWCDLIPGVRVKLRPLTTALMVSARGDPAIADLPEGAATEEAALAMAKALARRAVLAWEGIGDADGNPVGSFRCERAPTGAITCETENGALKISDTLWCE